jgi:hypothetical protein
VFHINEEAIKKNSERERFRIEVHVTEHCNLNCKGCSHFSPLCKPTYLDLNTFNKDCKRLSEITNKLEIIRLLGGEPLLHPQITALFDIIHTYLPVTQILILTNGTELLKMDETFWQKCHEHGVVIDISPYPVKLDIGAIKKISRGYRVLVTYNRSMNDESERGNNRFYKTPLKINGTMDKEKSFSQCNIRRNKYMNASCITLRDGKLYPCCIVAHIGHINDFFGEHFDVCKDDYCDIYEIKNDSEIKRIIENPIPFCRYCDMDNFKNNEIWGLSKKEKKEWLS